MIQKKCSHWNKQENVNNSQKWKHSDTERIPGSGKIQDPVRSQNTLYDFSWGYFFLTHNPLKLMRSRIFRGYKVKLAKEFINNPLVFQRKGQTLLWSVMVEIRVIFWVSEKAALEHLSRWDQYQGQGVLPDKWYIVKYSTLQGLSNCFAHYYMGHFPKIYCRSLLSFKAIFLNPPTSQMLSSWELCVVCRIWIIFYNIGWQPDFTWALFLLPWDSPFALLFYTQGNSAKCNETEICVL